MNDMPLVEIKNTNVGDKVSILLKFQNIQYKKTPANAEYASLIGFDGEDLIDIKIWSLTKEKRDLLKSGEVYIASGSIKDYQGKKQFNVSEFSLADSKDFNSDKFYEKAPMSEEQLQLKISGYINRIENELLKKIVLTMLKKYVNEYFNYPAAVSVHHNFISGLAYHVYSMLTLSESYLKLYPYLNRDLVFAGIILHDIGKVKELSGPKGTEYTKIGNLLGHISIGANMLNSVCECLGCSDTEEALALEHIILSHHGLYEYGSPKEPIIPEAVLIFLVDYGDSRMASLVKPCEQTNKGENTDPVFAFDRRSFYIPDIK